MTFQSLALSYYEANVHCKTQRNRKGFRKTHPIVNSQLRRHHQYFSLNSHSDNLPKDNTSLHLLLNNNNDPLTTATIASNGSPILSTQDIAYGTILAFALAYLWYFLRNNDDEQDLRSSPWELEKTNKSNELSNNERSSSVLNWKEMSRPENYVLYSTKVKRRLDDMSSSQPSKNTTTTVKEKRWVLVSLLVLFVPIFSIEFFFALSRQFLCGDPVFSLTTSSTSSWAQQLCSAHFET